MRHFVPSTPIDPIFCMKSLGTCIKPYAKNQSVKWLFTNCQRNGPKLKRGLLSIKYYCNPQQMIPNTKRSCIYFFGYIYRVSQKNAILCLMGHRGHQEWTRDKSRVSFENLRKFPFWWAQKLPIFDKKWLRKMRLKMPSPLEKWHDYGSPPRCSSFAHISMKRFFDHLILTILFSLNTMVVI